MRNYEYYIFFLLILLFPELSAQNNGILTGRITDKENSEPLVGANIYTKDNITVGAVSDFNGHYSISILPGDYEFTISFTGKCSGNGRRPG